VKLCALFSGEILSFLEFAFLRQGKVINLGEVIDRHAFKHLIYHDLILLEIKGLTHIREGTLEFSFGRHVVAVVEAYCRSLLRQDWNLTKSDASETFVVNQCR